MHRTHGLVLAGLLMACAARGPEMTPRTPPRKPAAARPPAPRATTPATVSAKNPLLEPWPGQYGGLPPFDQVKLEHFRPALEAAMTRALAELDAIAASKARPSFANTLAPFERALRTFHRVRAVFEVWSGALNTPAFQRLERELTPRLAAFWDKVTQNAALFARIEAVYKGREKSALSPEHARLAWKVHDDFVRAGARLDAKAKARLTAINQKLAALQTRFSQQVLADETDRYLVLDEGDLAGLPTSLRDAAAAEAASRKLAGKWVLRNTRSSIDPFLTHSERRELREKAWRMFVSRGDNGDKNDTKNLIADILALRGERARLLGYPTHAHLRLDNTMAKTPEAVTKLLEAVWAPAKARVREEVADMQALANRARPRVRIEPWDYRHYAEKVRKQKYSLDDGQIKPYLQLDKLREAMFWVAGELHNLAFSRLEGVPVFSPDVTVWLVSDRQSRKPVGLFYFDPFARTGKRSGAWMSSYRRQERLDGEVLPIVSNNCNFLKGKPGEPVLVSWNDAQTLFHEFGHALHGLLSNVSYPTLSGTAVLRDYVELPSQLNEHWLPTPEVLERFALHVETGRSIPKALVKRIERAATFNQGYDTVEYLASAFIDLKLHLATEARIAPAAFERDTLKALGMPRELVMRHRTPHFLHIFAGDGYSAGYYSYLWADVLTADAFEAFREGKGPFDKEVAARLRQHVLSAGNTVDPAEAYRRFRGRDASVAALMRKRGFAAPRKR